MTKRLKADFAWVLSGNVLYSACQWAIVVALAKLGSARHVGEYAFGLAISAPILLFANFQLRVLLTSDVHNQFNSGHYLAFRLVTLGASLAAIASIALQRPELRVGELAILIGIAQAFEFVSETLYGFMQKYERMDWVAGSLLMKGPLGLAAMCIVMYLTQDVLWAVAGLIAGRLLIFWLWDVPRGSRAAGKLTVVWDRQAMLALLRLSLPLGIISMLIALTANIPRYFIEAHLGVIELGIFSAIASLLTTGSLVITALGQSLLLPVSQAYAAGDRAKFRTYALMATTLGATVGGVAVLVSAVFGREILELIFRAEYARRPDILVRLMLAGMILFIASGVGYVVTAARSLLPQVPLLAATAFTSGIVSAWAIPRYGLDGAADAILAASLVQLVGTIAILWKADRQLQVGSPPTLKVPGAAAIHGS